MKISVAMTTYNGEKFIEKQINSILNQTILPDEIIICDDNSTDNTINIIKRIIKNSKITIKLNINAKSLGVLKNFSKAYNLCLGDIIFSCDQDDIWDPKKIEKIIKVFNENSNINIVATNANLIDKNDIQLKFTLKDKFNVKVSSNNYIDFETLLKYNCITGATMAMRKNFAINYLYESKYLLHDAILALLSSINNSLYYIDECLIDYRLHDNNVCGANRNVSSIKNLKMVLFKPLYVFDLYKIRLNTYNEIYMQIKTKNIAFDIQNMKFLADCIVFWSNRSNSNKITFKQFLKRVKSTKKYYLYTGYKYGKFIDIYVFLICKIFKKRRVK